MTRRNRWLLPEGIDELLPEQAQAAESLRRGLLDTYASWGYQLVRPPMIEFLESLQVGTGNDLALQTFTLTDQLSGRLMGLRADLTPQVARMDAHSLKREAPARLCYCAPVLHSTATHLGASRELDQIGIELFGSESIHADIEVIELMLQTAHKAGAFDDNSLIKLDLGTVAIFRSAARFAGLDKNKEDVLCDILQRKAVPELNSFIADFIPDKAAAQLIERLPRLCGDAGILEEARELFASLQDQTIAQALLSALDDLQAINDFMQENNPRIECYFDLSELRGYDYHTGPVFALYKQGFSQALAKGGRYDAIGESFGRSRPATGFSSDLRQLLQLCADDKQALKQAIFAPRLSRSDEQASALKQKVEQLRSEGETVVQVLSDEELSLKQAYCTRQLCLENGVWTVSSL